MIYPAEYFKEEVLAHFKFKRENPNKKCINCKHFEYTDKKIEKGKCVKISYDGPNQIYNPKNNVCSDWSKK